MPAEKVSFVEIDDIQEKVLFLFESEKRKLSELLPGATIEHIGSTAIPGTITKGDIDINVRVEPENFSAAVKALKKLYEINQLENWSEEFASFKDDSRDIGIQVTILGSSTDYFVTQREYLKDYPNVVIELNSLKEKFEGKNMDEYRKAKGEFFEKINTNFSYPDSNA